MVKAFLIYDEKLEAKLDFLIKKTSEDSFKLLSISTRQQDYLLLKEYLDNNDYYRKVPLFKDTLYLVEKVRIQIDKVNYYV